MNISKLLATAVLLSLAACAVKDDKASKVALHANDGTPTGSASTGGQPGKVTIMGALVVADAEKGTKTLKSGISLNLQAGKSATGTVAEVTSKPEDSLAESQTDTSVDSAAVESTYLNVGCSDDQIDKTYTNGLEAKTLPDFKNTTSVALSAKVVFICGNVGLQTISAAIKADTLVLNAVNLVNKVQVGGLDIAANNMVLKGQNRLGTMGVDSAEAVVEGPRLIVNVIKEVSGEGSLMLTSQGGNVIAATAESATDSTEQSTAEKLQTIHDKNESVQVKKQNLAVNR
ncbi:hypothetical protein B9G69_010915 [Bdellovibrio sp. SKB1291214]|uniref:hypothetical protein n=1 Tax=Bdellovibrio sp. SKB1291214 TaxID=1732569 RepID=UPI000B51DF30|nr:hypothetical protein [Bdellovibrio sp. SKB1291214]UYL07555.1 hypothetical protein B9G69_010915 [Bdellovibrio sp. SKB1291214]